MKRLHVNILEMKVVLLVLNSFLNMVVEESVVLMYDNATVVAYLKKQGGSVKGVRYVTGNRPLDGSSLCYSVNEVHS